MLNFCGSIVKVEYDNEGSDCLFGFRQYDNGVFSKVDIIPSIHPNILKGVITGKKSWGLWVDQFCEGISEGTFKKEDILGEFEKKGIKIPESLLRDFENRLLQKKIKFLERSWEEYLKNKNF